MRSSLVVREAYLVWKQELIAYGVWPMAGPQERVADNRISKSGGSLLVAREASFLGEREAVKGETYRGRPYLVSREAYLAGKRGAVFTDYVRA